MSPSGASNSSGYDLDACRSRRQREIDRMKAPSAQSPEARLAFRRQPSGQKPTINLPDC
jgi:hypothetical protein